MLSLAFGRGVLWPMPLYLVASVTTYLLYKHDKQRARDKGWRVPERMLHLGELLGGWPGALIAQQRFRHKTVKLSFRLVFFAIVPAPAALAGCALRRLSAPSPAALRSDRRRWGR